MKVFFLNIRESKSLASQIRTMEQQILEHRQAIPVHSNSLVRKLRLRLTAPSTLLLASGIGFIFGELTKRQSPQPGVSADKSKTADETSPLITALNLIATARTLYMALPIAWILKSSKQRQYRRVAASKRGKRPLSKIKTTADCA